MQRYDRLHVLINNAAQTLTRPAGWRGRMDDVDAHAAQALKKGSGGTQVRVRVRKGPARCVDRTLTRSRHVSTVVALRPAPV